MTCSRNLTFDPFLAFLLLKFVKSQDRRQNVEKQTELSLLTSVRGKIKGCPAEAELGQRHLAVLESTIFGRISSLYATLSPLFTSSPLQISLSAKFLGRDR